MVASTRNAWPQVRVGRMPGGKSACSGSKCGAAQAEIRNARSGRAEPRRRMDRGGYRIGPAGSVRVAVDEAPEHREPQDAEIEPQRPVADVEEVVLEALFEAGVAAEAVDLGPAGHAGLD